MRDVFVLAAGAALAVLALPNEVVPSGWGFLAPFFLLAPFWFTQRHGVGVSALGGVFWLTLIILGSQSWLLGFHPLAFPLVWFFQVPWYAGAFAISAFFWRRFDRSAVWLQALTWTAIEFLRIQGFFSFPYASLASAVWTWPVTFQSADIVGTSGITFLLAWASAWGAAWWNQRRLSTARKADLAVGLGLWSLNLGYGALKLIEPDRGSLWRPALVQHVQDPWKGGPEAYAAALDKLTNLSSQAMATHPDAVVWSETAFVPSVDYHNRYHENPDSLRLVRALETFLQGQTAPYILGNDHREKTSEGTVVDYNAVLAWDSGWRGRYEKNRLVPFTESFPYGEQFPWVVDLLKATDTHFWEPGRGRELLSVGGVVVGTPICYEDTFPDGARAFSLSGAQALVNLTNDSWAPGVASRLQHLSLAVFRAVETRLPMVRAGNDGATAAISSRGELLTLLPVGVPGVLQAEVPLGQGGLTWYTAAGDWLAWLSSLGVLGALMLGLRRRIVDKGPEL